MKKMIFSILTVAFSMSAHAGFEMIDAGDLKDKPFAKDEYKGLKAQTFKYSHKLVAHSSLSGVEKKVLNLFDGFAPHKDNPATLYIAKVTVPLSKPAGSVELKRFLDVALLQRLDASVKLERIKPEAVKTNMEGFEYLKYRNPPPPKKWCDDEGRTLCLKTSFSLPATTTAAFAAYQGKKLLAEQALSAVGVKPKKGTRYMTLWGQTEVRVETNEDIKNQEDLRALTGIQSPIAGVVTQNIFWVTHLVEYAKIIGVVQAHPENPNQSIVTSFLAFAIEDKSWEMDVPGWGKVKPALLSQEPSINRKVKLEGTSIKITDEWEEGIIAGLPIFTQRMAKSLAEEFDK